MGDRVAVMRNGVIEQCADPQTLYDAPTSVFVGAFMGSPAMNLFEATVLPDVAALRLGSQTVALPEAVRTARPSLRTYVGKTVVVGLRPEHLPAASPGAAAEIVGEVDLVEALGSDLLVHFTLDAKPVIVEGALDEEPLPGSGEGVARVDPRSRIQPGSQARFAVDVARIQFFDPSTGLAVGNEPGHPMAPPER